MQAHLDKAATLGGKTLVPPVEIHGQRSFAWLADPDGNIIGLWRPMSERTHPGVRFAGIPAGAVIHLPRRAC